MVVDMNNRLAGLSKYQLTIGRFGKRTRAPPAITLAMPHQLSLRPLIPSSIKSIIDEKNIQIFPLKTGPHRCARATDFLRNASVST